MNNRSFSYDLTVKDSNGNSIGEAEEGQLQTHVLDTLESDYPDDGNVRYLAHEDWNVGVYEIDSYKFMRTLCAISETYTDHVFVLTVRDEDMGLDGVSVFFVHDGQYYEDAPTIIYPDFDANKLPIPPHVQKLMDAVGVKFPSKFTGHEIFFGKSSHGWIDRVEEKDHSILVEDSEDKELVWVDFEDVKGYKK